MVIKILKIIGFLIVGWILLCIIAFFCFTLFRSDSVSESIVKSAEIACSIENRDYIISIGSDNYFDCSACDTKTKDELKSLIDWNEIDQSAQNIEKYFINRGGICTDNK